MVIVVKVNILCMYPLLLPAVTMFEILYMYFNNKSSVTE